MHFFEEVAPNGTTEDIPFVDEYAGIPENIGKVVEIIEVIKVRSGKGYLLKSNQCLIFLFNRSKSLVQILQLMSQYVAEQHGYGIFAQITADSPYFRLGVDSSAERNWFLSGGKYHQGAQGITGLEFFTSPISAPSPLPNGNTPTSKHKPKHQGIQPKPLSTQSDA
jgi:hypothetical protein